MVIVLKTASISRAIFLYMFMILLTTISGNTFAVLDIATSSQHIELGKSIQVTIKSNQATPSLNNIDLSPLINDFYIQDSSDSEITNNTQHKKIRIFPRKTGELSIPALYFTGDSSKTIPIKVSSASDSKTLTPISVNTLISSSNPWKKQPVIVKLELLTRIPIVSLDIPTAYSDHSDIHKLDITTEPVVIQNQQWNRHIVGWAVYPKQSGHHQLNLPGIRLIRDGVTTHQFFSPIINLQVKELPIYIPPTMNVGKLDIEILRKPTSPILLGSLGQLKLKLSGNNNQPGSLPSLNSKLKSNPGISLYKPILKSYDYSDEHGIYTEDKYDINFKVKQQGHHYIQPIELSYFDPENGTIKSRTENIGTILSIHLGLLIIGSILLLGILYQISYKLWHRITSQWRSYTLYKDALIKISNTEHPISIKHCLALISKAEQWPVNMTIRQWHRRMQAHVTWLGYQEFEQLEHALYCNKETNIKRLQSDMIKICYQRQKLLKWLPVGK